MLPKSRRIQRPFYPSFPPLKHYKGSFSSISVYSGLKPKQDSKFSFSISKKTAKNATVRNRMRRWGYKAVEKNIKYISSGYFIRFSIYSIPRNADLLGEDIEQIMQKSGILSK